MKVLIYFCWIVFGMIFNQHFIWASSCERGLSIHQKPWDWQGEELFNKFNLLTKAQMSNQQIIQELNNLLESKNLTTYLRNKTSIELQKKMQDSLAITQAFKALEQQIVRSYSLGPFSLRALQRRIDLFTPATSLSYEQIQAMWELGQFWFYLGEFKKALAVFKSTAESSLQTIKQAPTAEQKNNMLQAIYFAQALGLIDLTQEELAILRLQQPFSNLLPDFNHRFGNNQDLNWNLKHSKVWQPLTQYIWKSLQRLQANPSGIRLKMNDTQTALFAEVKSLLQLEPKQVTHIDEKLIRNLMLLNQAK